MPVNTGTETNVQARHRARFARSAVYEEFRARDARALDYDAFVDRFPGEPARRANPEAWGAP